jgi:photosystem II stability/assembly factor-like uncharacterized protein
MNRLIVSVSFAFVASVSASQSTWSRQSALPTDQTPKAVCAISPTKAIFVGDNKMRLRTDNAGASWNLELAALQGQDPYYMVAFPTPSVGIITGSNEAIRSVDGGATWQSVPNFPAGSWYYLDFVDASNGFAGSNGGCAATTDGGATWTVRSGYPVCPVMYGMDFRDTNVGLAGGYSFELQADGIFKTTDGGRTWIRKANTAANDVLWMGPSRAIADSGTSMLQTNDAGETWQTVQSGIQSGIVSLTKAGDSSVAIGVSGKGDVWRSADGGSSWVQVFDGPGALPDIWEVSFSDAQNGWITGPGSFFYSTNDGGVTWRQVNTGCNAQVFDMQMLDSNFGYAVGHNGYLFRTLNGGAFWDVQKLEVTGQIFGRDESLVSLDLVDRQFAVAAGPGGTVFKTTDGGDHWISIGYPTLPGTFNIRDIDFIDANLGYVYGIDNDLGHTKTLYRTRNGGATWEWISLGQRGGGTTIQFIDAQRGWLTADNRTGLRTLDGGVTWTEFAMPAYFTSPEVSKVRFLDANRGWVVGWDGYVGKSLDGGATWTLIEMGTDKDHFFDVVPVSATEIWICGREEGTFAGVVYHSVNGGQSWTRQNVTDWYYYPYRITALANGDVWFGGYAGSIFRKAPAIATAIPETYQYFRGSQMEGSLADLIASDDSYLVAKPGGLVSSNSDPIELIIEGTLPWQNPTALDLRVEGRVTAANVIQKVEFWNFASGIWETISTDTATLTDSTITSNATGIVSRFVEPGTRRLKAKVRWKPVSPATVKWRSFVDRIVWQGAL